MIDGPFQHAGIMLFQPFKPAPETGMTAVIAGADLEIAPQFKTLLDETAFYSRALSEEEVMI